MLLALVLEHELEAANAAHAVDRRRLEERDNAALDDHELSLGERSATMSAAEWPLPRR